MSEAHRNFSREFIDMTKEANEANAKARRDFEDFRVSGQSRDKGAFDRLIAVAQQEFQDGWFEASRNNAFVDVSGFSESSLALVRKKIEEHAKSVGIDIKDAITEVVTDGQTMWELDNEMFDNREALAGLEGIKPALEKHLYDELKSLEDLANARIDFFNDDQKYTDKYLQERYKESLTTGNAGMAATLKKELTKRARM